MTLASSPLLKCARALEQRKDDQTAEVPRLARSSQGLQVRGADVAEKAVPPDPAGAGAEAQAEAAARAIIISSREVACTPISSLS